MLKRLMAAFLVVAAVALTGCGAGGGSGASAGSPKSGEVVVTMKNLQYSPNKVTVKKGTKLTFVNKDAMEHDVWQVAVKDMGKVDPSFQSPVIKPTESWSIVMERTGTYPILCVQMGHFTAGMVATIEVVD